MRLIFILMAGLVWVAASAQQAEPLVFREKIHDFGTLREEEGSADYEFVFTNNSGRAISILHVQPSCGCTTPGWTKEPIAPGKTGYIKASFNPLGRPGYFNKTLTVTTDLPGTPVVLQIKGNVVTRAMETDVSRLEASSGSLRFKSQSVNLGKVFMNRTMAAVELKMFNEGETAVAIQSVAAPAYLKVVAPDKIESKAWASVWLTLDAKAKGQYGFMTESFELVTDDAEAPGKVFTVYATVEDYFPPLSETEKTKAPVLKLEADNIDIPQVKMGATVQREVVITNEGKQPLQIKALQPNCNCLKAEIQPLEIKPGAQAKLIVTFLAEGRKGTQHKAITIYSNDPGRPVQRLSVVAVVN